VTASGSAVDKSHSAERFLIGLESILFTCNGLQEVRLVDSLVAYHLKLSCGVYLRRSKIGWMRLLCDTSPSRRSGVASAQPEHLSPPRPPALHHRDNNSQNGYHTSPSNLRVPHLQRCRAKSRYLPRREGSLALRPRCPPRCRDRRGCRCDTSAHFTRRPSSAHEARLHRRRLRLAREHRKIRAREAHPSSPVLPREPRPVRSRRVP
jgi:hypothetical protein